MHLRPNGSLSIRTLLRSARKSGARERSACHWTPLRIDGGPVKAWRIGASEGSLRLPGAKRSALSCPRLDAEHVASQDPRPVAQARPRAPCLRCRGRSTRRPGRHPFGGRRPQEPTSDTIHPGRDLVHRGAGRDHPDCRQGRPGQGNRGLRLVLRTWRTATPCRRLRLGGHHRIGNVQRGKNTSGRLGGCAGELSISGNGWLRFTEHQSFRAGKSIGTVVLRNERLSAGSPLHLDYKPSRLKSHLDCFSLISCSRRTS